jgi:regulator of replication initiation timing
MSNIDLFSSVRRIQGDREEKFEKYYEFLEDLREFSRVIYDIKTTLTDYVLKNFELNVSLEDFEENLRNSIKIYYERLPNRYKQIVDYTINKFIDQRKISIMLYKNVPKLAEILNGKFSVKKENLSLGPFGLELEVEPEELERYTSKGTLGLAMPIYFEDNNQKKD